MKKFHMLKANEILQEIASIVAKAEYDKPKNLCDPDQLESWAYDKIKWILKDNNLI